MSKSRIQRFIFDTIARYDLSLSGEHGYQYYLCDSQNGLGAYNREPYLRLRDYFNHLQRKDYRYYLTLYVLIVYSFNNQIRFNQDGWFNLPVGKRDFNNRMQDKLSSFIDRLHEMDCQFTHRDFRNFETAMLNESDFVYADPPYLITCATYNEQDGWNEDLEVALYDYLDNLHRHHIRFALSNVLSGKGKENTILHEWLLNNPQYICHHLNYKYNNSNYHIIDRNAETDEVLVVNY